MTNDNAAALAAVNEQPNPSTSEHPAPAVAWRNPEPPPPPLPPVRRRELLDPWFSAGAPEDADPDGGAWGEWPGGSGEEGEGEAPGPAVEFWAACRLRGGGSLDVGPFGTEAQAWGWAASQPAAAGLERIKLEAREAPGQ